MFDYLEEYARENPSDEPDEAEEEDENQQEDEAEPSPTLGEKILVVSAGGSLFFDEKPAVSRIARFCEVISKLHSEGKKFVLVVGGGKPARAYVAAAKSFGATNFFQDELGIAITRANAKIFIAALEQSHSIVLTEPMKALDAINAGKIPVFGGLIPSFTTDAVAALIAEAIGGEFVNLTDVDGVYNADPKSNPNAKLFAEISYEKLLSLVKLSQSKPGQNIVLDLACVNILRRSQLKSVVLNGNNLENFEAFVRGGEFVGTAIGDNFSEKELEP